MKVLLIISVLLMLPAVFAVISESVPTTRLRRYCRKLKSMSPAALVEEALHMQWSEREYVEAVVSRISDSDALLQIGRDADSLAMRAAAKKRYCVLHGHLRLNEKCVCELCGEEAHDFRDEHGEAPKWGVPGAYPCIRCHAVYHVEDFPGCIATCTCVDCNDGDGQVERYSSQSGQGGSWFEPCPYYEEPGIRTSTTYEEQRAFLEKRDADKDKK